MIIPFKPRKVKAMWSPDGDPAKAGWRLRTAGGSVVDMRPLGDFRPGPTDIEVIDKIMAARDAIAVNVRRKHGIKFPRSCRLVFAETYPGNIETVNKYNELTRRLAKLTGFRLLPARSNV